MPHMKPRLRTGGPRRPERRPGLDPRLKRLLLAAYFGLLAVLFLASRLGSRVNRGLAGEAMEAWRELDDEELLR